MIDKAKILIVDDDPDIVKAMKIILESRSYQVASCANGQECYLKLKEEKPDLIILDIMMTKMDEGLDVCRELKKDTEYKNIPILMLTAIQEKTSFDFKSDAGDEVWLPVDDYVAKPIQPDDLLARVEKLLKQ